MGKSTFEEHMRIVEGTHTKTASASKVTPSLLDKLAAEMTASEAPAKADVVDTPAKTAVPAATTVAEAAPAVVAATESIAVPQTTIAGGNEAEKEKGMLPAASKPAAIIISDGDKQVTDAQHFSKEPAAVAEAAEATSKTSSDKEAEEIGRTMARSYVAEMQKIAIDEQFSKAVSILKEAGLLEGYKLNVEIEKKASEQTSILDKIANKQPLTKEEMVKAAYEYVELEKQAAEAEEFGRAKAREYFSDLVKQAQKEEEEGGEKKTKEEEEEEEEDEKKKKAKEAEKTSSDKAIEKAVDVLVKAGVINK